MNANNNPVIRVYPETRQKLKVLAAQHSMTMMDYVAWLVAQQIEREKGETDAQNSQISPLSQRDH